MRCSNEKCGAPVKPEIVFYGEGLPEEFMTILNGIENRHIDLLIVMGTALAVGPFNQIVNELDASPAVLINMENTSEAGFDFEDP